MRARERCIMYLKHHQNSMLTHRSRRMKVAQRTKSKTRWRKLRSTPRRQLVVVGTPRLLVNWDRRSLPPSEAQLNSHRSPGVTTNMSLSSPGGRAK